MLTDEQRARRNEGIGASDSPIIMGYSSYKTPYQLYLEKIGTITPDEEMTEQQYWGNALEAAILARFSEENDMLLKFPDTQYHPDYPFIYANLDGWAPKERAVVEAKCVNSYMKKEWDMALSDGIPLGYLIQIAKQCAIMDASRGYCAVLIGGMEYKQFVYERDLALEKLIIQSDIDFWECVQKRTPPNPVNTSDCRLKFPTPNPDKVVTATFHIMSIIEELNALKAAMKEDLATEDMYKMKLMSHMGPAEYLVDDEGQVVATWKATKKGTRVFNIK